MKYYLDVLYTDIIVGSIKGPIANGVYWFNQHVIDNVLNYTGAARASSAGSPTTTSTSAASTGIVNGIATVTGEAGGEVRRVQTGRLQFYALMLISRWGCSPCRCGSSRERRESAR